MESNINEWRVEGPPNVGAPEIEPVKIFHMYRADRIAPPYHVGVERIIDGVLRRESCFFANESDYIKAIILLLQKVE